MRNASFISFRFFWFLVCTVHPAMLYLQYYLDLSLVYYRLQSACVICSSVNICTYVYPIRRHIIYMYKRKDMVLRNSKAVST
jgi:hypothetical protein